jgi:pyruvate dehydrogenase E2 component (dihydrolipoamide acetyltransferase)
VPYTVTMPQLGESVAEGTLTRWFKRVGDRVEEDESLFEVSTDKVETEVPSPAAGWIVQIMVEEGSTVPVGTELCVISEEAPAAAEGGESSSGLETAAPEAESPSVPPREPQPTGAVNVEQPAEAPQEPQTAPTPPTPSGMPAAEAFVAAVESAVPSAGEDSSQAGYDSRSTMRLRWEPRPQELHARPSTASGAPAAGEQRLHAQPSRYGTSGPAAPPAPPKPHARITPEGMRMLEHPEEWASEVRPGGSRRGIYSPAVRKKAAELGVDLDRIVGTGAGGRITLRDVEEAAKAEPATAPTGPTASAVPAAPTGPTEPTGPAAPTERPSVSAPEEHRPEVSEPGAAGVSEVSAVHARVEPLTPMRIRIAEHMVEARRTAAHCFECMDVDMSEVAKAREAYKEEFERAHGFSLTYLPFIALATCNTLLEYPYANARIDMEARTMTYFDRHVNLGIAVDLDGQGLIVPVIKNAHELTVWELARRIHDLSERARNKKLSPDDVRDGTFTITNPGSLGTRLSVPIINTPEVGILSVEAVEDRSVVREGQVVIRKMTTLGLSWDHRAFDGADAARFLQGLKRRLEGQAAGWDWMVLGAPDITGTGTP